MADEHKWDVVSMLPDGHRLFPKHGAVWSHVAIADDSGREPQDTDDGILWLDFDRNLTIAMGDKFLIPLKDEDGKNSTTISNMPTLLMLSATFDWPIEDQVESKLYRTYITTNRRPVQATSKPKEKE
jgi:hypothetical protein